MEVSTISQNRLEELDCVLGLDCSKYQKDITWSKAKSAGIDFAFVKLTEGSTYQEAKFYNVKNRIISAKKNGVKIGYYHFARPANVVDPIKDADEEIDNFLSEMRKIGFPDLPFVLDIEAFSNINLWKTNENMIKYIGRFIDRMAKNNLLTIIYSYKSFFDVNIGDMFVKYPLWIAAYLNNPEKNEPTLPEGYDNWDIWQFTSKGRINGYNGNIDLNIMKKDYFNLF